MYPLLGYQAVCLINKIVLHKHVLKSLGFLPDFIIDKLEMWIQTVERVGIEETRKISGFHDEPLKGNRKGQRSIRLNRSYRAIYIIKTSSIEFIEVIEVNKHDY